MFLLNKQLNAVKVTLSQFSTEHKRGRFGKNCKHHQKPRRLIGQTAWHLTTSGRH
jgi:hypothetical protein